MDIAFSAEHNGFPTACCVFISLPRCSSLRPMTNFVSLYVILKSACWCRTAPCCKSPDCNSKDGPFFLGIMSLALLIKDSAAVVKRFFSEFGTTK